MINTATTTALKKPHKQTPEDIAQEYWNTETKRYHGSASRPPAEARRCGNDHRLHYIRHLRNVANEAFGMLTFFSAYQDWRDKRTSRTKNQSALVWSSLQVRPEVTVIISMLQARYLENTGMEISQAETINALVAAGLPHLSQQAKAFR